MSPLYPASFSTPCVTPIFWGKPSFGSSRRTCQIRLICEWDFGLTCLTDPHRFEKILPFQTPRKSGPTGAGMGIRGCFLTPVAKASHRPIQLGQRGDPALSPSDLQDFFFFGSYPHSPFLCLCGAVLYRRLHLSIPLIMFYRTLLGGHGNPLVFFSSLR